VKRRGLAAAGALCAVFALAHLWAATRYVVLLPGPVAPASELVDVEGGVAGSGALLVTAVEARRATLALLLRASVDPALDVRPAQRYIPSGLPWREYARLLESMMTESGDVAAAVAMRRLGLRVEARPVLRVAAVLPDSPAAGRVQAGDIVLAADGAPLELAGHFYEALARKRTGESIRLLVDRQGDRFAVDVPAVTGAGPSKAAGLLVEEGYHIELPLAVRYRAGKLGGDSAGLILALEVYDQLSAGRLSRAGRIAGTGALRLDGKVEPVEGVRQKVKAAKEHGATHFLVPRANVDEALAAAEGLALYPVDTFDQAVRFLERLAGQE